MEKETPETTFSTHEIIQENKPYPPSLYYEKYQTTQNCHETRLPKFAGDWGEYRKFILFPNHLPNLYLPTRDSYNETIPTSTGTTFGSRQLAKLPQWLFFTVSGFFFLFILVAYIAIALRLLSENGFFQSDITITERLGIAQDNIVSLGLFSFLFTVFAAPWYVYNDGFRRWLGTNQPGWQEKNKDAVFSDWIFEYDSHLKKRGINPKFGLAMMYLVHIYSTESKRYYWEKGTQTIGLYMQAFDREEKTTFSDAFGSLNEAEKLLSNLELYLSDALEYLSEQELREYDRFNLNSFSEQNKEKKKITDLPSTTNYRTDLVEQLHARTKRVSNKSVQLRWQALLDEPKFQQRILEMKDSSKISVASLLEQITDEPSDACRCIAIRGNSGLGKTTLVTQMAINLLEDSDQRVLPFLKKARQITEIKPNGDIGLQLDAEENNDPYLQNWLDSAQQKLLIVDGVDENYELNAFLLERLHKSAEKYKAHVLITGRKNTEPSVNFDVYELSNFAEDYLHRMIWETSDDPENRSHLYRFIPPQLKQHPLVLFSTAQILSESNVSFAEANLSYSAISELIFQRDIAVSKEKYGPSKDLLTSELIAKTIGEYITGTILKKPNYHLQETNSFLKASEWELIDSSGVNETLLEGYFIIQGFDEEKEDELSTVWDHLWKDDDEDRWESLIRAYLTTTKHGLPNLIHWDFTSAVDEFERIIVIAAQEWILGDLTTKKIIVQRLGLLHDEKGRIRLADDQGLHENYQTSHGIRAVMHFHCRTWMHEASDVWSTLDRDQTWSFFAKRFLKIEGPRIKKKAFNLLKTNGSRLFLEDREIPASDEKISELREYLEQFSNPKLTYAQMRPPHSVDLTELFGDGQLIPRDPFLPYGQQGYVVLPQPIVNFISEVFVEMEGQNEQNRNKLLEMLFVFVRTIDHRSGTGKFFLNMEDNQEIIQMFRERSTAVLSVNEKKWLDAIYAILRGHRGGRLIDLDNIDQEEQSNMEEEYIPPKYLKDNDPILVLDKKSMKYNAIQKKQISNVYIDNERFPRKPYKNAATTVVDNMDFYRTDSYSESGRLLIKRFENDGVRLESRMYPERLYSPLPHYLFKNSSFYSFLHHNKLLTDNHNLTWGILPWLKPLNKYLQEFLRDKKVYESYQKLDTLNSKLKAFGKVSNTEQAMKMAIEANVDLQMEYIGVCGIYRGPDEKNHFYVHILSGTQNNDIYVSDTASPEAWNMLMRQYIENKRIEQNNANSNRNLSFYVRFNIEVFQVPETKHCVISPTNLKLCCQTCLEPFDELDVQQDRIITSMCKTCLKDIRKEHIFMHHVHHFSGTKIRVDKNKKTIQIEDKNQRSLDYQRNSIQNSLDFFYETDTGQLNWFIDEKLEVTHPPDKKPYQHEGPNEDAIREILTSHYGENSFFFERVEEHHHFLYLYTKTGQPHKKQLIGRNGLFVNELKEKIEKAGLSFLTNVSINPDFKFNPISYTELEEDDEDLEERKEQREIEHQDMAESFETGFYEEFDRDYQRRRKGRK